MAGGGGGWPAAASAAATLGLGGIWERRRGDRSGVGAGASGWRSDEIGTDVGVGFIRQN
jgi:hypothetical protein